MKILFVTNLYPPHVIGGFEIRCGQIAEALAQAGHALTVLTSTHGVMQAMVTPGNPSVHRLLELYLPFSDARGTIPFRLDRSQRWRVTGRNRRTTRAFIERLKPDVVMFWSQARLSVGPARGAQDLGVPVAWTFGDPNITQYRPERNWRRPLACLLDQWLWRNTTWEDLSFGHAHMLSRDLEKRLQAAGLRPARPRVIYRGIPLEHFPVRNRPGCLHRPARLLYVGQLHPWKGVHTAIEALARLSARFGSDYASLTLAGEGPPEHMAHLRTLAADCIGKIAFLGRVAHHELSQVYRDHDIFLFPSAGGGYEGFGVTHLEAMASGLPVIGTLAGGQAELFRDRENCLVFPAEDPDALSRVIEELIENAPLRVELARRGRALVEESHTMEDFTRQFEKLLLDTIANHPRQ